jgi:hypothetical protein
MAVRSMETAREKWREIVANQVANGDDQGGSPMKMGTSTNFMS